MSALKYWLWLTELPGLTNQTRLALLQHFPTPEDVYYAEAEEVLPLPMGEALNRAVSIPASAKRRAHMAAAIPPPTTATWQVRSRSSQGY